jgi:hypothetical protein
MPRQGQSASTSGAFFRPLSQVDAHGLWSGGSVKVATLSSSEVGQGSWRPLHLSRNPLPPHWLLGISARSAGGPVESRRNRVFLVLIRTVPPKPPALWYTFTTECPKTGFLSPFPPPEATGVLVWARFFSTQLLFSYLYRSSPLWSVSVPVRALGSFLLYQQEPSKRPITMETFQCP